MKIGILALPGSMKSAVAGICDMFWLANEVIAQQPDGEGISAFEAAIITAEGTPVPDAQGRLIDADGSFTTGGTFDLVIVSGMKLDEQKRPVSPAAVHEAGEWLRGQHSQGALLAGACAGGLVLAEAGVLNGRTCTTTWWLYHTFRQRYPLSKPVWGKVLVQDARIITSGGPLSWVDVALHIIRLHAGQKLARLTADMAVADSQPLSQQVYAPAGFLNSVHPMIMKAEHIVRYENPAITVEQLARALNMTTRTLHRKMAEEMNESPKNFLTRMRIEKAMRLLEQPGNVIGQIAEACGYADDTAFRRAFSGVTGMSPGQYRKWIAERHKE
ncbi:helix-turn-helix domain-containing protein [Enterobacter bugandensis]|uniref:GlxA family transcriptional regulator n=1 Tax=Enterobacter bugandensis TaxID=881260 RepID=UPI0007934430|nr:helix-turn-helix domain-containing protein [Enterobacter bugandensis]MCK7236417.1 helix-turn-helix domain-containing protein [Enterobacter bugandensis]SAH91251.1 transcriptional regulator [Enterobacter bugandensis]